MFTNTSDKDLHSWAAAMSCQEMPGRSVSHHCKVLSTCGVLRVRRRRHSAHQQVFQTQTTESTHLQSYLLLPPLPTLPLSFTRAEISSVLTTTYFSSPSTTTTTATAMAMARIETDLRSRTRLFATSSRGPMLAQPRERASSLPRAIAVLAMDPAATELRSCAGRETTVQHRGCLLSVQRAGASSASRARSRPMLAAASVVAMKWMMGGGQEMTSHFSSSVVAEAMV